MNTKHFLVALVGAVALAAAAAAAPSNTVPPPTPSANPISEFARSFKSCDLFLEASTGVYTDTAGTISATNTVTVGLWKDQSSWGRDVSQGTALNCPRYYTNAVNGLPVVRFNGSGGSGGATTNYLATADDSMPSAQTVVVACSANWATITSGTNTASFVVAGHQGNYGATSGDLFCIGHNFNTIADFPAWTPISDGAGYNNGTRPRLAAAANTSKNLYNGSWHIFTFSVGGLGAPTVLRLDGADISVTKLGGICTGNGAWNVGSDSTTDGTGGRGFLGDMYFQAHFFRCLDVSEVRTIEHYVAAKLGINAGA